MKKVWLKIMRQNSKYSFIIYSRTQKTQQSLEAVFKTLISFFSLFISQSMIIKYDESTFNAFLVIKYSEIIKRIGGVSMS